MKPAKGILVTDHVLISDTKDMGRLFQKSRFGAPLSDNRLRLSLIESVFLIEDQKLNVYDNEEKILFKELLAYATYHDPCFEEKYLVFRDLRKRGIQVQQSTKSQFTFLYEKQDEQTKEVFSYAIMAISERKIPHIFHLETLIQKAKKQKNHLLVGLVDEEGDITYYACDILKSSGKNHHHHYHNTPGILLSNRVVIFDEDISEKLHQQEFFGKPFGKGLQLSLVEALFLEKKGILTCMLPSDLEPLTSKRFIDEISKHQHDISLRYQVFSDLKHKGLVVKTGFKFGTHFRAYQKSPFHSHAEYLIHVIDESYQTQWPEISSAVRLAHAVNKTMVYALVKDETEEPTYISMVRIRP